MFELILIMQKENEIIFSQQHPEMFQNDIFTEEKSVLQYFEKYY